MKNKMLLFLAGLLVTALIDLTFPFMSDPLTFIASGLLTFLTGRFFRNPKWGTRFVRFAFLFSPLLIFLIVISFVNAELLELLVPSILVSALAGYLLALYIKQEKRVIYIAGAVYFLLVIFIGLQLVPRINLKIKTDVTPVLLPENSLLKSDSTQLFSDSLKNKITVFDFWNIGCGVCRHVHPFMDSLAKTYSGRPDIVFYGVNTGTDTFAKARDFWIKKAYTNAMLYDNGGKLRTALGITAVPVIAIKDRNNVIRWKHEGFVAGEREILINAIKEEIGELEKEQ